MDKNIPKDKKGFNKLPEAVQEKISPKLAAEFNMGGMVDKRSPFMGGGIALKGLGKAFLKKGDDTIKSIAPKLGKEDTKAYKFNLMKKNLRQILKGAKGKK